MRRFLSLVLAAIMIVSTIVISTAAENVQIADITLANISNVTNATAAYDEYLGAVKVTPSQAGVTVSLTVSASANFTKMAIWVMPSSNSLVFDSTNGDSFSVNAQHKFSVVDVNETSSITISTAVATADTFYISAVGTDADAVNDAANGSLAAYTEDELVCNSYDVDKYTQYFWDAGIVYNESFYPVKQADGTFAPIKLSYDVDRVVSVQNSYLNVEFKYGVDYVIEDGMLVILPETGITTYNYNQVYSDTQTSWWPTLDGSYENCGQQMMFLFGYCNITYTVADEWGGAVPEAKDFLLPKTMQKLNTPGSTLKILSLGDSISGGANASGNSGVPPYADIWHTIVTKKLQNDHPDVNIEYDVYAKGGASASYATERMKDLLAYQPDLVMIEFGVNECMQGDSTWMSGGYIDTVNSAIASIHANLPNTEIILLGCTISNNHFFPEPWFYEYMDSLYTIETEGVAVADVTGVYQYLLTQKRYIDMAGDNLCHPNDYGMRIMAQSVLRIFDHSTEAEYISALADRMTHYRYDNLYFEEQWNEIVPLQIEGAAKIAECTTIDDARKVYFNYATEISKIQTAAEITANATIDVTNLVYNTGRPIDATTEMANVSMKYDSEENALVVTSVARKTRPQTYFVVDYTVDGNNISAEQYPYVVLTMAVPSANVTNNYSTLTFTVDEVETAAQRITPVAKDDVYYSYVIDMSEDADWIGQIESLKFGTFNATSAGDKLHISSIILCSDLESANDTAAERAYLANKKAVSVETYLIDSTDASAILNASVEGGEKYVLGDNNGDGRITPKDALTLRKFLADIAVDVDEVALDVDGDGEVSTADVTAIRLVLAGIEQATVVDNSLLAEVEYNASQDAAAIKAKVNNPVVTVDLTEKSYSFDDYKYVSLCAKNADESEMTVTVTVTSTNGTVATDTITIASGDQFSADTAKFATVTGNVATVSFEFNVNAGSTVYFDSFVLTPTATIAANAEIVRIGAANL